MSRVASWGHFPEPLPASYLNLKNDAEACEQLEQAMAPVMIRGLGRSYGDVCLNSGGTVAWSRQLNVIEHFDADRGVVTVQAGVSLDEILTRVLPHGWCVPVLPGTRHVTVGGAIANDVHGKNHWHRGSFCCFVDEITIIHNGRVQTCSRSENSGLFYATIGGIGLTGCILRATLRLLRVGSAYLNTRTVPCRSTADAVDMLAEADSTHEYSVAWIDSFSGRGLCSVGDHCADGEYERRRQRTLTMPRIARIGNSPLNVRLFNRAYYAMMAAPKQHRLAMNSFFFPLDVVRKWYRFYGKQGFIQYQFVVPHNAGVAITTQVSELLGRAGHTSYLTVLKRFGSVASGGLLSFPMDGLTVAMDLPVRSASLFEVLDLCDTIVADAGGRVYIAKDARMSSSAFYRMYGSKLHELLTYRDKRYSNSFWRRVWREA